MKRYSSLIIKTASLIYANIIIQSGLIVKEELKEYKKYRTKNKVIQCFKYYYYKYIRKTYKRL
jgi:hypothetical protein